MNPYIDEDLQALAEHARRFATDRIAPGFQERDRTRVLDRTLMREMGAMGFIAPELPEAVGGQGLGCLAAGVIHEEIARADLSLSYINLLASLNGQILADHGQPEVVGPWLQRLVAGDALLAIALTEPRGGSDAANLRLRMERVGDHYVINGEKTSISAADQADAAVVFARTGPGAVIEEAFEAAGLGAPRVQMLCESFLALPGLIAASDDWLATVPRIVYEHCAVQPQLAIVPVRDELPRPTICTVRRHDMPLTPAALQLVAWIQHYALKPRSDAP